MRILATLADTSACGYYRVSLPLSELNLSHGWNTEITMQLPMDPRDPIYDVDVFIVQRIVSEDICAFLKGPWREAHPDTALVYEIDDLVTHLHPSNTMAWDYYAVDNRLDIFKELVAACDGVTTTTPILADELRELNPVVYALDNCLPNWVTSLTVPEHDGPVRIVYTGGPSHLDDVKKFRYGIGRTIQQLGGRVSLTSYGHPWLRELGLHDEGHAQFRPWTQDFPAYQASLVGYDIGIAPLENSRFNKSKSAIKVYEYWAAGIVPIVSDVGPYSAAVIDGVDGFLCRTDDQWRKAIMRLVDDPELLEKMRAAGKANVEDLLIRNHAQSWEMVYNEVLEARRGGQS